MTDTARCTCGYQPADADDLRDHLAEVFTPADDKGLDGSIHAEAARDQPGNTSACLCGFESPETTGLDAHLLSAFTPTSHIAPDGQQHAAAPPA